jgi:hypothetical protein
MNPFPIKLFPSVAVYPTSWAGELTFEQLHDDLAHYAANVLKTNCPTACRTVSWRSGRR